ncbi:MAG: hypothetical protein AAGK02_10360 [Pseudomonadota bacterium]
MSDWSLTVEAPYPGPHSYRWQDRREFFGRDRESFELQNQIRSKRLSLLHAPSGAGKSSLINAGLSAPLEQDRLWIVAVARPGDDPIRQIAAAVLDRLFPSPGAETAAIRGLISAAAHYDPSGCYSSGFRADATLEAASLEFGALLHAVDSDPDAQTRFHAKQLMSAALSAGIVNASEEQKLDSEATSPVFHRFLDYTSGRRIFARQIAFLAHQSELLGMPQDWPGGVGDALQVEDADAFAGAVARLTLVEVADWFDSEPLAALHAAFHARHMGAIAREDGAVAYAEGALTAFLSSIALNCLEYTMLGSASGRGIGGPSGMAIVLDQFEELFTRLSYEVRNGFFDQLEHLYNSSVPKLGNAAPVSGIHFLISMRDEHVADLDRVRSFGADLSSNTMHLGFIEQDAMRKAIHVPAERFGFVIDETVTDLVIRDFIEEDNTVSPAMVQIVLSYVWRRFGNEISDRIKSSGHAVIDKARYLELRSTERIMRDYVAEVIDGTEQDAEDEMDVAFRRFSLMDILDQLTRRGDYRTILSEEELIAVSGKSEAGGFAVDPVRQRMLDLAVTSGLLRRYRQKGSGGVRGGSGISRTFVEVTHERLINGIRNVLTDRLRGDPVLRHLQSALMRLSSASLREARRGPKALLTAEEVVALDRFFDGGKFDEREAECAFRAALYAGADPSIVQRFAARFDAKAVEIDSLEALRNAETRLADSDWLDRHEVRRLLESSWTPANDTELAFFTHSVLYECSHEERGLILEFGHRIST